MKKLYLLLLLPMFLSCDDQPPEPDIINSDRISDEFKKDPISENYTVVSGKIDIDMDIVGFRVSNFFDENLVDPESKKFEINQISLDEFTIKLYVTDQNGNIILLGHSSNKTEPIINIESTIRVLVDQWMTFTPIPFSELDAIMDHIKKESLYSALVNAIGQSISNKKSIYDEDNSEMVQALSDLTEYMNTNFNLPAIQNASNGRRMENKSYELTGSVGKLQVINSTKTSLFTIPLIEEEVSLPGIYLALELSPKSDDFQIPIGLPPTDEIITSPKLSDDCYSTRISNGLNISNRKDADELALYGNLDIIRDQLIEFAIGKVVDKVEDVTRGSISAAISKGSKESECTVQFLTGWLNLYKSIIADKIYLAFKNGEVTSADVIKNIISAGFSEYLELAQPWPCLPGGGDFLESIDFITKNGSQMFYSSYFITSWLGFYENYDDELGAFQFHQEKFYKNCFSLNKGQIEAEEFVIGETYPIPAYVEAQLDLEKLPIIGIDVSWVITRDETPYKNESIKSSETGVADFTFTPTESGNYSFNASILDKEGQHIDGSPIEYNINVNDDLPDNYISFSDGRILEFSSENSGCTFGEYDSQGNPGEFVYYADIKLSGGDLEFDENDNKYIFVLFEKQGAKQPIERTYTANLERDIDIGFIHPDYKLGAGYDGDGCLVIGTLTISSVQGKTIIQFQGTLYGDKCNDDECNWVSLGEKVTGRMIVPCSL